MHQILKEIQKKVNEEVNKFSRIQQVILKHDPFEKKQTKKITTEKWPPPKLHNQFTSNELYHEILWFSYNNNYGKNDFNNKIADINRNNAQEFLLDDNKYTKFDIAKSSITGSLKENKILLSSSGEFYYLIFDRGYSFQVSIDRF